MSETTFVADPMDESETDLPDEILGLDDDREPQPTQSRGQNGQQQQLPPARSITEHVGRLSDRAIQRIVGANAFLRGRVFARRGAVAELSATGFDAIGKIAVRSQDEPFVVELQLSEGALLSSCSCQRRGPSSHCKHVAAILVALRDRERPPRQKQENGQAQQGSGPSVHAPSMHAPSMHAPSLHGASNSGYAIAPEALPPLPAQTVSAGGKRRRSRRRRRGEPAQAAAPMEVLSAFPTEARTGSHEARGALDAWLAPDDQLRPYDFEFRLVVRAASISVTAVLAGTRSAVPLTDALASFNGVPTSVRPLLRVLARAATRSAPATAEVRGEDASEVLSMLQGRRVLIEPASMELRFHDEPLRPRIELDATQGSSLRVRVAFEQKSTGRRFSLSNGAWFEGTPGWYIDTTDGIARPIIDTVTPAWLQRLFRSPALVQPNGDLPRLLTDFIPRVAASLGIDLPDIASVADIVDASPLFQLKANGDIVEARAKIKVVYNGLEFDVPPKGFPSPLAFFPPGRDGGRPRVVRRDVGAEMAAVQQLLNLKFVVDENGEDLVARGDDAIGFWTDGIGSLPEEWDRFIPDDLVDVNIRKAPVAPQMRIASGVDWLSLDMSFSSEGIAVSEDELRMCLEKGRRLIKLADGSFAPVQAEQVGEVLERLAEIVASTGGGKKLPLSQAGRVQDLMRLVSKSHASKEVKELFGKLEDIGDIESIAKPRALKATLRDYQKRGFSWLVFLHNIGTGGILADDMGLGKTLQAIALLCWVKSKKKDGLVLVVAPTSVVPNWQREIEKFAPSLETIVWQGPDRHAQKDKLKDADVMITSYALLRRDEELLQTLGLTYVILDEAQHIKNPLSATARAAKKLKTERRLALSGTPIENRLSEIWSIIDFVSPGLLGNLKNFEEKFARPIDRGDEATINRLRAAIHPFVLRRTKSEVAPELPAKIEQEIVVPLAEEQSKLYKQILKQVRDSVMSEVEKQGVAKAQIQILAALTRLRQVACDPRLIDLPGEWNDDESGKLAALREIMSNAMDGGHRVLVFSQFVSMLKLIRTALDEDGVKYEYLDGSTKDRQERVDRFNKDPKLNAFLISLKAGGTGLNLTGADTVVHFDPWWNPAVEDQATDRAHRIGQTKAVSVYRLVAKGTVEEKILQLSAKKRELVSNVLSTEGSPVKGLTKADLAELFSD